MLDQAIARPDAYELLICADGATIRGGGEAGLFYGVQTLIQILRGSRGSQLPTA